MAMIWLWIPVALVLVAVFSGSLVVMSHIEHRRDQQELADSARAAQTGRGSSAGREAA